MRNRRRTFEVLVEDPKEGDYLEDPGADGRMVLKLICKKWDGEAWNGLIWLRIGTCDGLL
jgi:hypothetical protein